MASITTKFDIGDPFWTFDPQHGEFTRHIVVAIGIKAVGDISMAPEVVYSSRLIQSPFNESDCLSADESHTIGNLWLADKAISMFSKVGL